MFAALEDAPSRFDLGRPLKYDLWHAHVVVLSKQAGLTSPSEPFPSMQTKDLPAVSR